MATHKKNGGASGDEPKIGHNSNLTDENKQKLAGYVEEIEKLEADARAINADRGNIYKAAKEAGFDTKALRHTVRMRRMEKTRRNEFEAACEAYAHALGDFVTTALGKAAAPKHQEAA